jgi:long-chain acyl-CoA synthetase
MKTQIIGNTLPEIFFKSAQRQPQFELYFTKRGGRWEPLTYEKALQFVLQSLAGLKRLGVQHGDKIIILAENREEWILTDLAAQWLGAATAAIYTTSTIEQIEYIVRESDAKVLFVSNSQLAQRLSELKNIGHLSTVVAWEEMSAPQFQQGLKFESRQSFLRDTMDLKTAEQHLSALKPSDLAVLLYTSGTTGEPKGVMLTQNNLVSNLRMFVETMPILRPGLITISFLPLSHIYERSIHNLFVALGIHVYFAESIEKLIENIGEVRPHVMTAVPRIFEKMYSKIHEKIRSAPAVRRMMFAIAQKIGEKTFEYRYTGQPLPLTWRALFSIADVLVFKKIRAVTGGRAELFISGGAPISVEIVSFFFRAGFKILEGYGLSETCILCVNREDRFRFGTVGLAFPGTDIKIAEDGEILCRGPQVMSGYYKRPDATAEAFTADGWFKTGDIGLFDADGFLKITDRKKEILITAGGKNIPPQPIENALKKDSLMESVCLIGDRRKHATVLIVPNLENCRAWAARKGETLNSLADCSNSTILRERFTETIERVNKDLPQYSTIKDFRLLTSPFSPETGELTPTLKLKRRVIDQKYAELIDSMYPSSLE